MVVGEVATSTDTLIIGGGPGGYVAALAAAQRGGSVTLVEKSEIGGVCLNVGCIPSKALIHAAELAALGGSSHAGVSVQTEVDHASLQAHISELVKGLTSGVAGLLSQAGVDVQTGLARFSGPTRVAVVEQQSVRHIEFSRCIIATGSRPIQLDSIPFDGLRVLDSTAALHLLEPPQHLVVVGGGYIGVELGTAWSKLGSYVTIVEVEKRLLSTMEPSISRIVQRRLRSLGVEVRLETRASELTDTGLVVTTAKSADSGAVTDEELTADVVVVAVGRRPNTDDLGLGAVGVTLDEQGLIIVDPARQAAHRIHAIGDITAGPALAHKATAEALVAVAAIHGENAAFDPSCLPAVVFCDPEVAEVGLTPTNATMNGVEHRTFRFPYSAGSRSRTLGRTEGFIELVADLDGTVIGAVLAGHGVSELVAEIALAIELAATVEDLAATIHPHPTQSEAVAEAAHGLMGHPIHISAYKQS